MKHSRAESSDDDEQHANSWVERPTDGGVQSRLASGAKAGQKESDGVKLRNLPLDN